MLNRSLLALTCAVSLNTLTACGSEADFAEADDLSWLDDLPLVALATPCTFATSGASSGTATVTLAAGGEVVLVAKRVVDSAILVNGTPCGSATATTLKKINITGGAGDDTVIVDYINGTFGAGTSLAAGIVVDGAGGTDGFKMRGTSGADTFTFGASGINFAADTTRDITVANAESYAVATGDGADTVTGAGAAGTGTVFTAALTINGGDGADTLTGGSGADTISGGAGADTISGGAGNDVLNGDADSDTFNEGSATSGADTFNGGAGTADHVTYAARTAAITVTVAAAGGADNDGEAGETDDVVDDVEVVTGGTVADTMTCQAGGCTLNGGAGADTLNGAAGADTLNGDAGNDTLTGAAGADVLSGGDGDDTFAEEAASTGGDIFNGGAGTDLVDYSGRSAALTVTMDGVAANDGDGTATENDNVKADVENCKGGSAADTITGNALANVLTGGAAADVLSGGDGDDVFSEGAASTGGDVFNGGAGIDTVDYSLRVAVLTITMDGAAANDGDGTATENDDVKADVENVVCGNQDDTVTGNDLDNAIDGGAGADTLTGGIGNDVLDGGAGADTVTGGADDDICIGETVATCEL